jgi:diphosphomevalonate decarboxylase
MIDKKSYVAQLIPLKIPATEFSEAFAPANIALCKYWGKKNLELNLPTTPSLSISLGNRGSNVNISIAAQNYLSINNQVVASTSTAFKRTFDFLNLFAPNDIKFAVQSSNNIPTGAGLASSASYFAALTLALNELYNWQAPLTTLSCLARLGSGSACRSLYHGFVKWLNCDDPLQSYGIPLTTSWEELRIGLLIFDPTQKSISSRQAILHTQSTSPFYKSWCENSIKDFEILHSAINQKNFQLLGETAEYNTFSLHAVMLSARPAIIYSKPSTLHAIEKVHELRCNGVQVYLTQDAGPNLKLLFLEKDLAYISNFFSELEVVSPFAKVDNWAP